MKAKSFAGMRCSVAAALEMIGDRWTLLLLRDLGLGLSRFEDFRVNTGIPNTTLTTRLRDLEAYGIVERVAYSEKPPRDEYRLTEKGRDLWKVNVALREWGDRWDASGFAAPTIELVDCKTNRQPRLALVDTQTGRVVPRNRIKLQAGPGADETTHRLLRIHSQGST